VAGPQIGARLRLNGARWPAVCARADASTRPEPGTWSPLEYACHVRDVCTVFDVRVKLMLSQEGPQLDTWNQNVAAAAGGYRAQDPATLSAELSAAVQAAAASFDAVGEGGWRRTGRRSSTMVFTVETLGRYLPHDLTHHLHDVRG
jgi:hypothetical protein